MRHVGYKISQVIRKRIEEHFGWMTASNIVRMARILYGSQHGAGMRRSALRSGPASPALELEALALMMERGFGVRLQALWSEHLNQGELFAACRQVRAELY